MRVLLCKNGKVAPGRKKAFTALVKKEKVKLKKIHKEMVKSGEFGTEDLNEIENRSDSDWIEEAKQSLISASYRFGDGTIWGTDQPRKYK